jgi:hypothetical protein
MGGLVRAFSGNAPPHQLREITMYKTVSKNIQRGREREKVKPLRKQIRATCHRERAIILSRFSVRTSRRPNVRGVSLLSVTP